MEYVKLFFGYLVVAAISIPIYCLYGESLALARKAKSPARMAIKLLMYTSMTGYIALILFGPIPRVILGEECFAGDRVRMFAFYAAAVSLAPGSIYYARKYAKRGRQ
jgi:hypothetical protein